MLALIPHEPGQHRIDPDRLAAVSASDLGQIQRVLIQHGLSSTRLDVSLDSVQFVGRILLATRGAQEAEFIAAAREYLDGPTSPEGNRRKAYVCEVLQIYPIRALGEPVLRSLQRLILAENREELRRFVAAAHPALNAMVERPHRADWRPSARTTVSDYQTLHDEWLIHLQEQS